MAKKSFSMSDYNNLPDDPQQSVESAWAINPHPYMSQDYRFEKEFLVVSEWLKANASTAEKIGFVLHQHDRAEAKLYAGIERNLGSATLRDHTSKIAELHANYDAYQLEQQASQIRQHKNVAPLLGAGQLVPSMKYDGEHALQQINQQLDQIKTTEDLGPMKGRINNIIHVQGEITEKIKALNQNPVVQSANKQVAVALASRLDIDAPTDNRVIQTLLSMRQNQDLLSQFNRDIRKDPTVTQQIDSISDDLDRMQQRRDVLNNFLEINIGRNKITPDQGDVILNALAKDANSFENMVVDQSPAFMVDNDGVVAAKEPRSLFRDYVSKVMTAVHTGIQKVSQLLHKGAEVVMEFRSHNTSDLQNTDSIEVGKDNNVAPPPAKREPSDSSNSPSM